MIRLQNAGFVAVLAAGPMFTAAIVQAEIIKFTAEMIGAAEVPTTESAATGTADVTLDTEAKTITWTYTYFGLSGHMTVSHIHGPAAATEVAKPAIDTMTETLAGSAPITDVQAAALKAGMYYFNIHAAKFPDGEIRGQLVVEK